MIAGCKLKAPQPVGPVAFGYKMKWVTVRGEMIQDVIDSLRLVHPRPANWPEGIECAYRTKGVFIAPPLNGWIAIVGFAAEDLSGHDSMSPAKRQIESASEVFHVSCSFATHRVTEYHHWMRAEEGRVTRCFAYLGERGEVLCNEGPVTFAERALRFANLPPDQWQPDQEDVMKIAGAWSYDPSKLTPFSGPATLGVIADWK